MTNETKKTISATVIFLDYKEIIKLDNILIPINKGDEYLHEKKIYEVENIVLSCFTSTITSLMDEKNFVYKRIYLKSKI